MQCPRSDPPPYSFVIIVEGPSLAYIWVGLWSVWVATCLPWSILWSHSLFVYRWWSGLWLPRWVLLIIGISYSAGRIENSLVISRGRGFYCPLLLQSNFCGFCLSLVKHQGPLIIYVCCLLSVFERPLFDPTGHFLLLRVFIFFRQFPQST
jgi:hypothetical protein